MQNLLDAHKMDIDEQLLAGVVFDHYHDWILEDFSLSINDQIIDISTNFSRLFKGKDRQTPFVGV